MSRLFWKIFFSFWLVMILLLATNLAVTWVQAYHFEQQVDEEHVSRLANRAVEEYQTLGVYGYNSWRKRLFKRKELRMLLLNERNRDVSGEPIPRYFRDMMEGRSRGKDRKFFDPDEPHRWFTQRDRPVTWQVADAEGRRYTFVLLNPKELSDHLYGKAAVMWRLGISILVVALVSLLLSLYMVRPIRQLQETSQALANGDLSSRVPKRLNRRRDELGELASDFDTMAEKIEQLIMGQQDMLRDVSHELRTPLARLRIALELARKRSGESTELDRMELEAERINALIDDILQLVRLNHASYQVEKAPLELCRLLASMASDANLSKQRVSIDCREGLTINTDRKLLSRTVENVLQNALKYSEKAINVTVSESPDHRCVICIDDQGPGVDPEQLAHLFDPFYRTDSARGRQTGGYGLGLAIAAQSIKAIGGTISAKNREEGGLRVEISLPVS